MINKINSCDGNEKWNKLFKLVFDNIVLFRLIFKHVRLFKKNENLEFNSLKELREYKEREHITRLSLVYNGGADEIIEKGDLPTSGMLKEVSLFNREELKLIKNNSIPNGVEIINYCGHVIIGSETSPLSKLPSTIHTINFKSRFEVKPIQSLNNNNVDFLEIPPHVTSVSFYQCPNLSGSIVYGNGFIKIPNTIKTLKFSRYWNNETIPLQQGDIPEGVTSLHMGNYLISGLSKSILPSTIKELFITCRDQESAVDWLFSFMPPNVESLSIEGYFTIPPKSTLPTCKSINKLELTAFTSFKASSLPPSVTDLKITGISSATKMNPIPNTVINLTLLFVNPNEDTTIPKDVIPKGVVSLKSNKLVTQKGVLPSSLEEFQLLIHYGMSYSVEDMKNMMLVIPKSLTSITLPIHFKKINLTIPPKSKINKIIYI